MGTEEGPGAAGARSDAGHVDGRAEPERKRERKRERERARKRERERERKESERLMREKGK